MKFNDAYPSNYMKAEDLEDGDLIVTIRDESPAEWVEFTQKGKPTPDNKPVLYFKHPREAKALVLNKTNWKTITEVLGSDETEDWSGKQITLYATEVESFGETVLAIRVRLKKPIKGAATQATTDPSAKDLLVAGIKKVTDGWGNREEVKAEVTRQLAAFNVERIGDLDINSLRSLKDGMELWASRNGKAETITSDDIGF